MISNRRRSKLILGGGVLLAALGACGIAFTIWTSHSVAEREWRDRLSAITTMASAHARQSIGAADLVLRGIADSVNDFEVSDQQSLRNSLGSRKAFDMLRDGVRGVPQIDVATIVAANGDVINLTRGYPAPPVNLADRDYFQAHAADDALEIFLSAPVQNRGDGGWSFYLARKIRGPDGRMAGLVLTGLKSDFFSDFYGAVSLGVSRISLHRADGPLLARYPVMATAFGASFAGSASFRVLGEGTERVALDQGPRATDGSDARPRLVAARRSADYPIVVAAAATREVYLAQWARNAWPVALAGGLLCLLLVGATIVLERLVRQLERARSEAMLAVEAKSRFVATVSHEIRTPLNAVIGGAAHLMETNLPSEPRAVASLVSVSAQHLLMVINGILDFSRLETTVERIEEAPFDARTSLGNLIAITRSLPEASGIMVREDISDRVPAWLLGDSNRMTQILLNLLSNAVKYTNQGSVTLRADYIGRALHLCVEDTGVGLSVADQARLFEPFERGAASGTQVAGTGLGLAITKRLTHALGGAIHFKSLAGQGSTFCVELPMEPATPPCPQRAPQTPAADARRLSVLIAEDMAANRMLLASHLRKLGHAVVDVDNGRDALAAVRERAFDVVLMDVRMPHMGGVEATRAIRALPAPRNATPIIAVTAFGEGETHAELRAAGVTDILTKPVDRAQLASALARVPAGVDASRERPAAHEDDEVMGDIHRQFLLDLASALDELDQAYAARRLHDVAYAAHKLSGAFGMFAHSEMARLASATEAGLKDCDIEELLLRGRSFLAHREAHASA